MDSGGLSSKSDSVCVLYHTMSSGEDVRSARECEEHCKVSMYKVMILPHFYHMCTIHTSFIGWVKNNIDRGLM